MTNDTKQCITCNNSIGVMTCNGCQQIFCGKHSLEHRHQLANQLDSIMREHSSLQREFERSSKEHNLFKKIDIWEREAVTKVHIAAETARFDLQQMIDKSRDPISKTYRDIAMNLGSSREADDYSENELNRWMNQLKQLKSEVTLPLQVTLVEDEWSIIKLIKIKHNDTEKNIPVSISQDRFSKVIGGVTLDNDGLLAKHTSNDWNYEYVLGEQHYSEGRHTILFKIEQSGIPYNIFFGCISSEAIQKRISINSQFTVGWFGFNQTYQHGIRNGNPTSHGYNSNTIATNDVLYMTFDCDKKQIELFHEDSNKRHILTVNTDKAPLPWQLLMMLTDKDDCVRILSPPKLHSMNKIQMDSSIERKT
ncbi:unnamed protein product [Adineta steineri]|uniref:B box-type domain-containing protein n=1 Tax=Adineta steineri TaxID=433720 RepID=A0A819AZ36_9BILA|nr:unnamed protein product [Adineta steineri]CAF3795101.1 unnamed protein product [Adineta steineri]